MSAEHRFVLRFSGEVSTKGRQTRLRFAGRIVEAAEDALASHGIEGRVKRIWSRLFVTADDPAAGEVLSRIFGVQSVSPARRVRWRAMKDIVAAGEEAFGDVVAGRTFAVRVRRTAGHPKLDFDSPQLERALGARLAPRAAGVDLGNPEVTAGVEVHEEYAYLFSERLAGPGGLPIGVEGKALALVSGGFDSAVACWEMWKRGVAQDFVFFNLGGAAHEAGAAAVVEQLARHWAYGDRPQLHLVDLQPFLEPLQEQVKQRYWQLALKALMLLAADALADELKVPALVTGEALGQVSSQTLTNLTLLDRAVPRAILRPLLTANKEDIVAAARRIGTYEQSAVVPEFCSLAARHAETKGHAGELAGAIGTLDREAIAHAVADREIRDARSSAASGEVAGAIDPEALEPGWTVIDLRTPEEYRDWHWPDALHLPYPQALQAYGSLDREQRYVFYCEVGLKSAHLASLLQEKGVEARHVPRGAGALRRLDGPRG